MATVFRFLLASFTVLVVGFSPTGAGRSAPQGLYYLATPELTDKSATVTLRLEATLPEYVESPLVEMRILSLREMERTLSTLADVEVPSAGPVRVDWRVTVPLSEYRLWLDGAMPRIVWRTPATSQGTSGRLELRFAMLEPVVSGGGRTSEDETPDTGLAEKVERR